jgi:hypothetical protein
LSVIWVHLTSQDEQPADVWALVLVYKFHYKAVLRDAEGVDGVIVGIPIDGIKNIGFPVVEVGKVIFDDWLAGGIEEGFSYLRDR